MTSSSSFSRAAVFFACLLLSGAVLHTLFVFSGGHLPGEEAQEGSSTREELLHLACQLNEFMSVWKLEVAGFSVHFLDLVGSLVSCRKYRLQAEGKAKHWLKSMLCCVLMQFGGTSLTGLLLGQPPSWTLGGFASPRAFLIAWWLVFCCPGDAFMKLTEGIGMGGQSLVWCEAEIVCAVSSGHGITTWGVDKVVYNSFHAPRDLIGESIVLSLLSGVLSSNGGSLLVQWFNLLDKEEDFERFVIFSPSKKGDAAREGLCRSFLLSCAYLYLVRSTDASLLLKGFTSIDSKRIGHLLVSSYQILNLAVQSVIPNASNPILSQCANGVLDLLLVPYTVQVGCSSEKDEKEGSKTEELKKKIQ